MRITGILRSKRSAGLNALVFVGVAAAVGAAGTVAFKIWDRLEVEPASSDQDIANATQVETIFMPLDREIVTIPAEAIGSGGALTSWGGVPVVVTASGEFFAVENGEATKLDMSAPENHVEDYAAYIAATSDRDPFDYWFRYNDILYVNTRGALFVSYSLWDDSNDCFSSAIASVPVGDRPAPPRDDWTVIYKTEPCLSVSKTGNPINGQMAGGRLALAADGKLLLSSGDYGRDGIYTQPMAAQSREHDYGKIIEIDLDTGSARQISIGHSNPQGIAVDRAGQIWVAEHGRRGGDELNRVLDDRNYGWPLTSLGTRYNKLALPTVAEQGKHAREFEAPAFAWLPSVAPGALMLIDGFDPMWDGDLLMGTLKDQALYRIRIRDNRVLFTEKIPVGQRVRYLQMLGDGRIAIFTDAKTVEFLTVGAADHAYEYASFFAEHLDVSASTRSAFLDTVNACAQCHSLGQFSTDGIPALGSLYGKPFSASIAAQYAGSLPPGEQLWNEQTLTAFLDNPGEFAPGTAMPDPMLEEGEILSNLVLLLYAFATVPQ